MNREGEIEWQDSLGGEHGGNAFSIMESAEGSFIVAGDTTYRPTDLDEGFSRRTITTAVLWGVSASGSTEWKIDFGDYDFARAVSLAQARDGGYVVAGDSREKQIITDEGSERTWYSEQDGWVAKLRVRSTR